VQRNEKLILIRDVPAAVVDALDAVMAAQGLMRIAVRELQEDFTPLLTEAGGPIVFVLSQPQNDWTACFSSLAPDDEWQLTEALAVGLEQPTVYALFNDVASVHAYRYFEDGVLHEERTPEDDESLSGEALIERLKNHGIPLDLIDDRALNFGAEHILVGYSAERPTNASEQASVTG
jgi:hypothetical protein